MKDELKKIILVVFLLTLISCASKEIECCSDDRAKVFTTTSGLECALANSQYGYGLSCNWEAWNRRVK